MTKVEIIQKRQSEHEASYGKYAIGPCHIFNSPPTNKKEALQHGNALAASGNYPVGTSECFNVGISGGCGLDCYIYREGRCESSSEMISELKGQDQLEQHYELYPQDKP